VVALRVNLAGKDAIIAELRAERERLRAEAEQLRKDWVREREIAAAREAERNRAAFDRDMYEAQLNHVRALLEPERDALLMQRSGLAGVVSDETLDVHRRIAACECVIANGGLAQVVELLESLRGRSEHAEVVGRGLALCRSLVSSGILARLDRVSSERPTWKMSVPVLQLRAPSADKIVLIFMAEGRRFWSVMQVLLRVLEPFGQHLMFLSDSSPRFFLHGVDGLRPGYANSIEDLRKLAGALGDLPIYCLGSSKGGFAALRYGLDLGAEHVLAFSPWTSLAANDDSPAADEVWTSRCMGADAIDLKPLFAGCSRIPRLTIYYGALNGRDARHARRLADLPGVRVLAIEGYGGHGSLSQLIAQRKIEAVLGDFLEQRGRA
jgi:hypothetical protein